MTRTTALLGRLGLGLFGLLLLAACTKEGTGDQQSLDEAATAEERQAEKIIYGMPSPPQVLSLLKRAGAQYDPSLLNNPEDPDRYATSQSKALNIGIYGTDLAYASLFDQNNTSLRYFVSIQNLADDLGISAAFDRNLLDRAQANRNDQDSLLAIFTEGYRKANETLKANNQTEAARLMLIGGWVEGLYLATSIYNLKPNDEIGQRIAEQKLTLENLLEMIAKEADTAGYQQLATELQGLKAEFDKITVEVGLEGSDTDEERQYTRINNTANYTYTAANIMAIGEKAAAMRNRIIQ